MLSYFPNSLKNPYQSNIGAGFKVYEGSSILAIKTIVQQYTWSPIIWRDGYRKASNFICAHYLGLDFENPEVSIDDIERSYCDTWHIIGTTKSHQKQKGDQEPCDRFRLVLRLERPITSLEEYKYNTTTHIERLGADPSGNDGARIFHKCSDIIWVLTDPDLFDEPVLPMPEKPSVPKSEIYAAKAKYHHSYGRMTTYARTWLLNEIPIGQRSVTVFILGKELCRAGLTYEDSINRILASPTYSGRQIDPDILRKIYEQVSAGFKAIEVERGVPRSYA